MNLEHICGNTYVLRHINSFPIYLLDKHHVILMDTGYAKDLPLLISVLEKNALKPVGILSSHTHVDHCGGHAALQAQYGCQIAASLFEAAVAESTDTFLDASYPSLLPASYFTSPRPIFHTDFIIKKDAAVISFCGAEFHVIPLSGHTFGQIGFITPDNVAYLADALLSPAFLNKIRLPSARNRRLDIESKQQLRHLNCKHYVLAHSGVYENIQEVIDENLEKSSLRANQILQLLPQKRPFYELAHDVWMLLGARTKDPLQIAAFQRSILSYLQVLAEDGYLDFVYEDCILFLKPSNHNHPCTFVL